MVRVLTISAVLATALAVGIAQSVAQRPNAPLTFQDDAAPEPVAAVDLTLGERFSTDGWELEVQDAFVTDSQDRAAYVEVRASVAFRSLTTQPLPYDWAALAGSTGFPTLTVKDSSGVVYPIDTFEAANTVVPGSDLVVLEPYVPVRWTVGFEANAPQADQLAIEASWNGNVVASWDVYSAPAPLVGWDPPPDTEIVAAGTFGWDDALAVSVNDTSLLACGDPSTQPVYVSVSTGFSVENEDVIEGLWPNVRYPQTTAIAVWADGSSAQATAPNALTAAVVGEPEETGNVLANARNNEQLIVPGSSVLTATLTFDLPRDGRFGDVTEYPSGIILYPPDGPSQWFDVAPGIGTISDECTTGTLQWVGGTPFQAQRP